MSSIYKYVKENSLKLDIEVLLKICDKLLNQTAKEFPEYLREDLLQVAKIRLWKKADYLLNNWSTLSQHPKKVEHYIRQLARNEMKKYMQNEVFQVSLDVEIPNNNLVQYPEVVFPDKLSKSIPFKKAISYTIKQILNGLTISINVLSTLLPNDKIIPIIINYSKLQIKKQILDEVYINIKQKGEFL